MKFVIQCIIGSNSFYLISANLNESRSNVLPWTQTAIWHRF